MYTEMSGETPFTSAIHSCSERHLTCPSQRLQIAQPQARKATCTSVSETRNLKGSYLADNNLRNRLNMEGYSGSGSGALRLILSS